jgi:HK97 family phage prohead protease
MLVKTFPAACKAVGDPAEGVFEAIVSVFGNKDSYGDVVMPGAFTDSLAAWKASGNPIPVYYSHRMDDPDFNIGHVVDAKETDRGLWVKAQLDVADALPGSKAPQVHRLMKGGRLSQFSFAYEIHEAAMEKTDELGDYFALRKLGIYEVGPTPVGANDQTELLAVKSAARIAETFEAGMKAGRTISAKNESELRTAHEALGRVLDQIAASDEGKTSGNGSTKDEEPAGAKSDESAMSPSVDAWVATLNLIELEGI